MSVILPFAMKTSPFLKPLVALGLCLSSLIFLSCSKKEGGLEGRRYKDIKDKVNQQNASLAVMEDEIRELNVLVQQNNRELNKLQITQESLRTRLDVAPSVGNAPPARPAQSTTAASSVSSTPPLPIINLDSNLIAPPSSINTRNLNQPFSTNNSSSQQRSQVSTPTPPASSARSYTVRRGDTFSNIAKDHNVSVSALRSANSRVNINRITVGMKLNLPSGTSTSTASSTTRPKSSSSSSSTATTIQKISYTVRSGDTLSKIARKYGISINTIKSYNPRLNPNRINVGQKITIPVRKKTSSYTPSYSPPTTPPRYQVSTPAPSTSRAQTYQVATRSSTPAHTVYSGPKKMIRIARDTDMGRIASDFSTSVYTLNSLNSVRLENNSPISAGSLLYVPAR